MEVKKAPVEFKCKKCQHQFTEYINLPMRVEAFLSRLKGWEVCPNCGANGSNILMTGGVFFTQDKEE